MEFIENTFSGLEQSFRKGNSPPYEEGSEIQTGGGSLGQLTPLKKYILLGVVSILLFSISVYMFGGEDTENTIQNIMSQIQMWFGTFLLGGYLSASNEMTSKKNVELDENVQVEINELLSL